MYVQCSNLSKFAVNFKSLDLLRAFAGLSKVPLYHNAPDNIFGLLLCKIEFHREREVEFITTLKLVTYPQCVVTLSWKGLCIQLLVVNPEQTAI